jgi:hypothetical protein
VVAVVTPAFAKKYSRMEMQSAAAFGPPKTRPVTGWSESDKVELRQVAEENHLALTRLVAIAIGGPTASLPRCRASAWRVASRTEMPNPFD